MLEEREFDGGLEARLAAREGAPEILAGPELEALDDLRSTLFDLSRVEESEDLSRLDDPEDFSLVDSFLSESPDFRCGSLLRSTLRSESPLLSRAGASLFIESRRASIFRCDLETGRPGVSRERTVSLV